MTDAPSGTPLISDLALGISLLSAVGWIATALMARAGAAGRLVQPDQPPFPNRWTDDPSNLPLC